MYAAVNETANAISPLSTAISNGIFRSINFVLKLVQQDADEKTVKELAYALKLEYPHESDEYVLNMAYNLYEGVK